MMEQIETRWIPARQLRGRDFPCTWFDGTGISEMKYYGALTDHIFVKRTIYHAPV